MGLIDFDTAIANLEKDGLYEARQLPPAVHFENAEQLLRAGLAKFVGAEYKWPKFAFNGRAYEPYNEIINWMDNNQHKGLTLLGACGQGKTVIAREILPVLVNYFLKCNVHCFDAVELARRPDEVMQYHWLMIDDIGTEQETVDYGNRRQAFAELVDAAEKHGKLLIVTTNLTQPQLQKRYGERVVDRLLSLTKGVVFKGKSMRK